MTRPHRAIQRPMGDTGQRPRPTGTGTPPTRNWARGTRGRRIAVLLATLALVAAACSDDDDAPAGEAQSTSTTTEPTEQADAGPHSRITAVDVEETGDAGVFGGLEYVRVAGQVRGLVMSDEDVVGLDDVTTEDDPYEYTASFELLHPEAGAETVVVEPENRGLGLLRTLFDDEFLLGGGRAYARVAWQAEINSDVPESAQGIGQVIMRDFGRLLRQGEVEDGESPLGPYEHTVLSGWSQGAWFATTLVAEGFNVDPADSSGVFDGVLGISAAGNVLAINSFGDDGRPQEPYIRPDARPLEADEILTRPQSDPVFVDIANYTDFYRLRSGLTSGSDVDGYWRYDWPSPHAPGAIAADPIVFERFACNGGQVVPTNPTDFRPYARALLAGLELEIGAPVPDAQRPEGSDGLPAPAEFELTDEQPEGTGDLNALPDVTTPVPAVDDELWPRGGVRFAEAVAPLGQPSPVGLPPVSTEGPDAVCGNFGGWVPADAAAVLDRWPTVDDYLADFDAALDPLVEGGYVLSRDLEAVRTTAGETYRNVIGD